MKTNQVLILSAVVFTSGVLTGLQFDHAVPIKVYEPEVQGAKKPDDIKTSPTFDALGQTSPTANDLVATIKDDELASTERILELEQQLATRDKELQLLQQSLVELMPGSAPDSKTSLTLLQAQAIMPEPFATLIAKQTGLVIDYLHEHQSEPVDSEWAYELEQQIRDYFASHENAAKLRLSSVSCKTSLCEIRGFEYQPNAFTEISSSLSVQPWWRFGRSYTIHDAEDNNGYFYLIAKKAP